MEFTAAQPNPLGVRATIAHTEVVRARLGVTGRDRVLVLQHRDRAPTAQLMHVLSERGLQPVIVQADEQRELPPPASLRMGVVVGANRYDVAADSGTLAAELEWLRRADRAGTPILGLGFGARALASALGGGVERAERGQRGWALVDTTVPHFIAGGPWLAWQHEIIRLPARAEVLAHNRLGPQAFKIGRHLGVNFHPDATPGNTAAWVAREPAAPDYQDTLAATGRDPAAARACARRLFSAFIDTLQTGGQG